MESANKIDGLSRPFHDQRTPSLATFVRPMTPADEPAVAQFVPDAIYKHFHADWYNWEYWLQHHDYLLSWETGEELTLSGALAVSADVLPIAWIQVLALNREPFSRQRLRQHACALFDEVNPTLQAQGVKQLLWMSHFEWVQRWAEELGFTPYCQILTFAKDDLEIPAGLSIDPELRLRAAVPEELKQLAQIEAAVYEPMWRHTAATLLRAYQQCLVFRVAVWHGRVVGFQISTPLEENRVHLARITVSPEVQGRGIGRSLLVDALRQYERRGRDYVSLNTQDSNVRAQALYRRFGFVPTGQETVIWGRVL